MKNNRLLNGSIDLTKLGELARAGHPAVVKAKNGKTYVNLSLWINSEPDKYDNIGSLSVYDKQSRTSEYFGNVRDWNLINNNQEKPVHNTSNEVDDFPF